MKALPVLLLVLVFLLGSVMVAGAQGVAPSSQGATEESLPAAQEAATMEDVHEEAGRLKEAASLLEGGKVTEAREILDEVRLSLWNKAPLRCPVVAFVEEGPESFGVYRKRPSHAFVSGETMYVYAELENYTILQDAEVYHTFITVSYNVYDSEGNHLGGEDPWENFRFITQRPVYEFFLRLSFDFNLEPGEYTLEVTVKDRLAEKETSFQLPFKVL